MRNMSKLLGAGILSLTLNTFAATAAEPPKTVILVHGAFVDGSSWSKVIPLLQAAGLRVVAVQNPLTSLTDDVAATERAIEAAPGDVILVGHSWGGMVITEGGTADKVKALVYVAAFALPKGQSVTSATAGSPPAPWTSTLQKDSGDFLTVPQEGLAKYFAQDATPEEVEVLAAIQQPSAARLFDERLTRAASETKPSWFVVAKADGAIPPAFEESMAKAIKAHITELEGNHLIMLTKPRAVADVIIDAVKSVQ